MAVRPDSAVSQAVSYHAADGAAREPQEFTNVTALSRPEKAHPAYAGAGGDYRALRRLMLAAIGDFSYERLARLSWLVAELDGG